MGTQLIVYPQSYEGVPTVFSLSANEFIVDGNTFSTLNTSVTNESFVISTPFILTTYPPTTPNTWYRYRLTSSVPPSPDYPTATSGNMVLSTAGSFSASFAYQRVTNLNIGQAYFIYVNPLTSATGILAAQAYDGANAVGQNAITNPTSSDILTTSFVATSTSMTILVRFFATATTSITIGYISVLPASQTPEISMTNGQVICDLYEEENIPLTLSVDDFKNAAEKVQSYSKAFKLPGTKRNNKIFENLFEVTRTSQHTLVFNPYAKTQCALKQDGFILFEGYLRVIDIQDKEGEISYNVNLYSEVIALADLLGDKTFSDLGFEELQHLYNYDNIKASWLPATGVTYTNASTSGYRTTTTIAYPFVDWNHSYTADGTTGYPVLPNLESSFRPFVSIKYIVDRIFAESNMFTYSSDFFNTIDFKNLYIDFNWGADNNPYSILNTGCSTYETEGQFGADNPVNYATTSWSAYEHYDRAGGLAVSTFSNDFPAKDYPASFGWDNTTFTFTNPAGQDNHTFNFTYDCRVVAKQTADIEFRWVRNYGLATETIFNASGVQTITGSAIAFPTLTSTGVQQGFPAATSIIYEAGYYTGSPPTGELNAGAVPAEYTTTLSGTDLNTITKNASPTPTVLSIWGDYLIEFNGVNPYYNYTGAVSVLMQPGDTLQLQWKASTNNCIREDDTPIYSQFFSYYQPRITSVIRGTITYSQTIDDTLLQTQRGEVGQWDFLKGIMTMFNLISMPDPANPNNILIEPYKDIMTPSLDATSPNYFDNNSTQLDWTEKVDITQIKLKPLTDLKRRTIFKFVEDDDDWAFTAYKIGTHGHLYGSQVFDATTTTGGFESVLKGNEEVEAEPFAATVSKPLMEQFTDFIIPSIYSYSPDDGTSKGFDNSPRIMYRNGVHTLTSCTYSVPEQSNVAAAPTENQFLQFSHLTDVPTIVNLPPTPGDTQDFHFGVCQLLPGLGSPTPNNLFNTYWLPYYNELYHPDTRIMSIKVALTPGDINTFKFYDTIFIKNRSYRVNKIDYKPNDLATVELILII